MFPLEMKIIILFFAADRAIMIMYHLAENPVKNCEKSLHKFSPIPFMSLPSDMNPDCRSGGK
jgi:hypothetical protein